MNKRLHDGLLLNKEGKTTISFGTVLHDSGSMHPYYAFTGNYVNDGLGINGTRSAGGSCMQVERCNLQMVVGYLQTLLHQEGNCFAKNIRKKCVLFSMHRICAENKLSRETSKHIKKSIDLCKSINVQVNVSSYPLHFRSA